MKKRIFTLAMAILMAAGLFGCGKKNDTQETKGTASKDYVYKMEKLDIGAGDKDISYLCRAGDSIYAYGYDWSDDGDNMKIHFYELNDDGATVSQHTIQAGSNVNFNSINFDVEGNIYCIKNMYYPVGEEPDMGIGGDAEGEDGESPGEDDEGAVGIEPRTEEGEGGDAAEDDLEDVQAEEAVAEDTVALDSEIAVDEVFEEVEYVDDYYLSKISLDGQEFFSVKLNDIPELAAMGEENGYFYVGNMILEEGKGIYLTVLGNIVRFDPEGNYVGVVASDKEDNPLVGASLIPLGDGRIMATLYEDDGISFAQAELEKGALGEKFKIPGRSYDCSFFAGKGYDLYLSNNYGLYGYNLGDTDKTAIMNFIDSDFGFSNLYQIIGISDTEFFGIFDDSESMTGSSLAKFTKIPPAEVKEKQELTLAMGNTDWNVRQSVIKFNQSSDTIRIRLMDYSNLYGSDEDWKAGVTRLNTDIASGKVPDIVVLDDAMPVDSYISKGLFEDLKPYIEKDQEFSIDDFMPNVIEAYSVDGKLYSLVPSYSIQTLAVKTADVGDKTGWTVQEAVDILKAKPEGCEFLVTATRMDMMQSCISMSGNQFIDWESGKCNFNSDEFIKMLEFIGTFPEEIDQAIYTDEFWNNYDSMWREGKVLANFLNLGDFRGYNIAEKGTFGEKITPIGFPSSGGKGSVIRPDLRIAMSAKSSGKESAWEFLRTFLSDEYQRERIYNFPLRVKLLDELAQKAMKRPYYEDEEGNKVEYDDTYWMNGVDVTIPPMTEQEVTSLKEWIGGIDEAYKMDDTLINIISEEAAPYYAGQKNARDVAGIIQSRAQLYVNENR